MARNLLSLICVRDDTEYLLAKKVSDKEFKSISIDKIPPLSTTKPYQFRLKTLPIFKLEKIIIVIQTYFS